MWLAYTMNGVVYNEDGTLNEESVTEALKYMETLIQEELVDPADKTSSGMDAYKRLTGGSASFLTGPTSFVSRSTNPEECRIQEELVDPADKTSSGMDAYKRLTGGSASFLTGPTSFVSRSTNPEECSVVGQITPILTPGKEGKSEVTMALPEALGVTKFSKNKEAAKKFVEWYTSADMQKKLNETNSAIPTRNSVLEELINDDKIQNAGAMKLNETNSAIPTRNSVLEELINDDKIQNAGAMLEEAKLISSPFPDGIPSYYAEMSNAMYNAINKMALGELTADEALKQMDTNINELVGQKY